MSLAAGIRAGRAFVEIGANSAPLEAALQRMRARLASFGAGLAAVGGGLIGASLVGGGAIASVLSKFAEAGSAIADAATRTGAAASAMSEYGYAAEMTGASLEDVEKAMKQMVRDGKAASEFDTIAASIAAIADPTEQAQAALEHWGKSGIALLPMARQLAELRAEAKRLGITMTDEQAAAADELGDSMDNLSKSIKGSLYSVMAQLAPMITGVTNSLSDAVAGARQWIDANAAMIRPIALAVGLVGALGAGLVVAGGTIYAGSVALGLLSSGLGALVSPLGLVTIGAAGVVTALGGWPAVFRFAESAAKGTAGTLETTFSGLGRTLATTFDGVAKAVASGQTEAAFRVVAAGMKVIWLETIANLKRPFIAMWSDFSFVAAATMGQIVYQFKQAFASINFVFGALIDAMAHSAENLLIKIAGKIAELGPLGFVIGDGAQELVDKWVTQRNADFETRQRARQEASKSPERDYEQFLQGLQRDVDARFQSLFPSPDAGAQLEEAQRRLSEITRELSESFENARKSQLEDFKQQQEVLKKPGFIDSTRSMTQFNASFASRQVGFRDVQDRIAANTEATAKGVADLVQKADSGLLVG